ncbi:uncharacterized protein [Fopius arisanus]|uniref:Pgk protein n=1 Tax=Fopius arisanus TaxID=64838 RepID=A0A0C9QZ34_9HYME|nr:PREDICTED: uncharacterized protein LOC105266395 [Fopius arisanus]
MSRIFWPLVFLLVGLTLAAMPVPHQTSEDTLRSALNAVTRKQRSLGALPQDYYGDLRSFKYHGDPERKFEREEVPEMDDDEDDLEFLPLENGQLENIGGGYQGFNNKRLERALMDYLEMTPIQRDTGSSFRERERIGTRKRTMSPDHATGSNRELARLFLDELQNSSPYGEDPEDAEYLPIEALQSLYDRYRLEQNNKYDKLDSPGPMSWGELLAKDRSREDDGVDFADRERSQHPRNYLLYQVLPTQRRNINARYPIGREYRDLVKRFPVAKRSTKPFSLTSQATDPKVVQDLGALFGPQASEMNKTQVQKVQSKSNHVHGMDHMQPHTSERPVSFTTDITSTTFRQDNTKEKGTKPGKTKEHLIEIKKKSVDWSQYFGIDRRRKKASLLARPGTQEQDDEWMLQRYYKTMADNLQSPPKDLERIGGEKRDKLDQMDEKLKNVKNVIIEDAVRYSAADDDADPQEVKDVVMARMAAAYSLEKMRKALNEFRNSIAAQRDVPRNSQGKNNSSNGSKDSNGTGDYDKRSSNAIEDEGSPYEGFDEGKFTSCPELEAIERSCKPARNLVSGLFVPCMMHQICRTCDDEDECMGLFAMEAARVCDSLEEEGRDAGGHCARTALVISQMQPPSMITSLCHGPTGDSCLRRYQYRNRHRFYPSSRRHSGFDAPMKR